MRMSVAPEEILEAQQLNLARFPGARLTAVGTDEGGMLARRIRAELANLVQE